MAARRGHDLVAPKVGATPLSSLVKDFIIRDLRETAWKIASAPGAVKPVLQTGDGLLVIVHQSRIFRTAIVDLRAFDHARPSGHISHVVEGAGDKGTEHAECTRRKVKAGNASRTGTIPIKVNSLPATLSQTWMRTRISP
jgi:hypothetical protein